MREITYTKAFKKDYKRLKKSIDDIDAILGAAIDLLAADHALPIRMVDHPLSGDYRGFRDCHLKPDTVLIYRKVGKDILELARIGSHSNLFE